MISSSDGSGGGYNVSFAAATPQPGLPVAGSDSVIGDPYQYGKFQNFLPEVKATGQNAMATGLRPEMFNYVKPNPSGGTMPQTPVPTPAVPQGGGGGAMGSTMNRDALAQQMLLQQQQQSTIPVHNGSPMGLP